MIRRAAVTGAGGFVGQEICRQLAQEGVEVRALVRRAGMAPSHAGVVECLGDIRDQHAVTAAFDACDVVFHTAAKVGMWGAREDFLSVNVEGTRSVLGVAKACGVRVFVDTSSPSVVFSGSDLRGVTESDVGYAAHFHAAYSETKAQAEQEVLAANSADFRTLALRPHLVWGPGDRHILPRLISRSRAGRLMRIGDGENIVDTTFIEDAASAHLCASRAALENAAAAGRAYFISQGEPVKLWWLIDEMLRAAGAPQVKKSVPMNLAVAIGGAVEFFHRWFRPNVEPPLTPWVAREMGTSHWFDIRAARELLGYKPRHTIAQGLEKLRRWCDVSARQ